MKSGKILFTKMMYFRAVSRKTKDLLIGGIPSAGKILLNFYCSLYYGLIILKNSNMKLYCWNVPSNYTCPSETLIFSVSCWVPLIKSLIHFTVGG